MGAYEAMSNRKNVLWIVTDQQRGQALGVAGDPNVHTPNLDNLCRSGAWFSDAVSGYPLCCPFRGSMLTGVYPHKCVPAHEARLDPAQPTIANVMNDHGYDTFYLGKWHLDGFHEWTGERAANHIVPPDARGGFRTWIGYENNNSQWDCWIHGGEGDGAFHRRLPGFETDALTDMMIEYLDGRAKKAQDGVDEPFFAVLSVQPPHDPYLAPEKNQRNHNAGTIQFRPNVPDVARVRRTAAADLSGYYAQIENIDENVGRIVDALRANGLMDDTHIIFVSDHGDMHGSHGHFRKTSPHEESIRIPFIIAGEHPMYYDRRGCGRVPDVLVSHVDIAPTTLGLCGIEPPEWMEGTDYSRYRLRDNPVRDEPDSVYLQGCISPGHGETIDKPWRGIVTKDGYKYACFEGMEWMLYNLNEDPYEQVNLVHYGDCHALLTRMNEKLRHWIESTGDTFRLPEIVDNSPWLKALKR